MTLVLQRLQQKAMSELQHYRHSPTALQSYEELTMAFCERTRQLEQGDFSRDLVYTGSKVALVAIHGGDLEPGTAELAEVLSGERFSRYIFRSHIGVNDFSIWLTSAKFNDPELIALLGRSMTAISIHGCKDARKMGQPIDLFVGGRNQPAAQVLMNALTEVGVRVERDMIFPGLHRSNPCNLGRLGEGIQLEMTSSFREEIIRFLAFSRLGGFDSTTSESRIAKFVGVMNGFLEALENSLAGMTSERSSEVHL